MTKGKVDNRTIENLRVSAQQVKKNQTDVTTQEWEKIFENRIYDKELLCKMYKNSNNLINKQ